VQEKIYLFLNIILSINERRIIIVKNTGILSIRLSASLALCLLAVLLLAGKALGEVSREGLVGEWHFDGDANIQTNYDFPRISKN